MHGLSVKARLDKINRLKESWKVFQRQCDFRKWQGFGSYRCKKLKQPCPRTRFDKCRYFGEDYPE